MFGAVLWTNISLMIALAINDHKNLTPILVFAIGFIPAIGVSVLAVSTSPNNKINLFNLYSDVRFKYLCDPNLVMTANVEPDAIPAISSSGSNLLRNKVVQWEENVTSKKNHKFINGKLYNRLMFPTDVEIAARFVLTV